MSLNLKNIRQIFIILLFIILCGTININLKKPELVVSKQESALNINNNLLLFFSAGQKRLLSDLLWITTLLESDLEHYKKRDLNSWLYLRFNSIISLDPKFLEAYQFGGQYLSIVKDDLIGGEQIYLKGLSYYPEDYSLNFNLGFLYAMEMKKFDLAIPYFEKVQFHHKAPRFLPSIVSKLKYKTDNSLEFAYQLNLELFNNAKDETVKNVYLHNLYSIKAEIDLDCLNNNKKNCSTIDQLGKPYIFQNNKWSAQQKYRKFDLFFKEDQ
jgi:hypothetical protein